MKAVILVICVGCSQAPAADPVPVPVPVPVPAEDAAPVPVPVPMPVPDAGPDASTLDPEAEQHVGALAGEHQHDWAPSAHWLVAHPDVARPALRHVIATSDAFPVTRAILILGDIAHPDDAPFLVEQLRVTTSMEWELAVALGKNPGSEAFDGLVEVATTAGEEKARAALHGLAAKKDERARAVIEGFLEHESETMRWAAVLSLYELGWKPSKAKLRARVKVEKDRDVKDAIKKVLAGRKPYAED